MVLEFGLPFLNKYFKQFYEIGRVFEKFLLWPFIMIKSLVWTPFLYYCPRLQTRACKGGIRVGSARREFKFGKIIVI
jgi:hypothetical protein